MISAIPVRDKETRDDLLESIGLSASDSELLLTVTEEKALHAFFLFQFVPQGGRVTRVISFHDAEDASLDLGLRAVLHFFDTAGVKRVWFVPSDERFLRLAKAIGFTQDETDKSDFSFEPAKLSGTCKDSN